MIKLKDLLLERDINEPEFMKILNAAKKQQVLRIKYQLKLKDFVMQFRKKVFIK